MVDVHTLFERLTRYRLTSAEGGPNKGDPDRDAFNTFIKLMDNTSQVNTSYVLRLVSKTENDVIERHQQLKEEIEKLKNENRFYRQHIPKDKIYVLKKGAKAGQYSYLYYILEERILKRDATFSSLNANHVNAICAFFDISRSTFNSWREGIEDIDSNIFDMVNKIPKQYFNGEEFKPTQKQEKVILEQQNNRKKPVEKFPWYKFPKIEEEACKMFLNKIPYAVIIGYIFDKTGLSVNTDQLSQRFNNSPPPAKWFSLVTDNGKSSWFEIWAIWEKIKTNKSWQKGLKSKFLDRIHEIHKKEDVNEIFTIEEIKAMRKQYFDLKEKESRAPKRKLPVLE